MTEEQLLKRIRDNTKKAILAAGYSNVEEFASTHSLDKSTLSRLLAGQREPRISTLHRIAHALHIGFMDLLEGKTPPTRKNKK